MNLILEPWPLNEQQLRSFLHDYVDGGPLLLLAGAGSGKTAVMTRKIALHIFAGIPVDKILALTFTRRAAREMKTRVINRLEAGRDNLAVSTRRRLDRLIEQFDDANWITTFHAACWRILNLKLPGDSYPLIGRYNRKLRGEINLLSPDERAEISRMISRRLGHSEGTTEKVLAGERHHRDQFESYRRLLRESKTDLDFETGRFMQKYENFRKEHKLIDLQDIVTITARLLRADSSVQSYLDGCFHCQLVDEFQDNSLAQLTFLARLAGSQGAVCAVGDDFQAIYEWRGARPRLIRKFDKFFPAARKINLNRNYRSTGYILFSALELFADRMISEKRDLHPTRWTEKGGIQYGDKLVKFEARSGREEADYVAYEIDRLCTGEYSPADFAIFYRFQRQKFQFIRALRRRKVPFAVTGMERFFNLKVPKAILALVKLLAGLADFTADSSPDSYPTGIYMKIAIKNWWQAAAEIDISQLPVPSLETIAKNDCWTDFLASLPSAARLEYSDIRQKLLEWCSSLQDAGELVQIMPAVKKKLKLYQNRKMMGQYRQFKKWLQEMDFPAGADGLARITNRALLQGSGPGNTEEDSDKVQLMTLHSCKGLEFKVVFMVGLVDGIFPGTSAGKTNRLAEEKRLFYVGITRAEDRLYFSYHLRSRARGGWQRPTRFLEQIPLNYLDVRKAPLSCWENIRYFLGV